MISFKPTEDGSATLYNSDIDECYHSTSGAREESTHIFINNALLQNKDNEITVLEIGFGTGLNALLTIFEAKKTKQRINYHTIELYPLDMDIINEVLPTIPEEERAYFLKMHSCAWNKEIEISEELTLTKHHADITKFDFSSINADIVYFDAFSPEKQPELWSETVFKKIYDCANVGAILTTYCSKGVVRRTMQAVGFNVEKLNGCGKKRHITRARKIN